MDGRTIAGTAALHREGSGYGPDRYFPQTMFMPRPRPGRCSVGSGSSCSRCPGQALGLAVLVAVLAAALVSAPLMIASAEQGAWEQERDRVGGRTSWARRFVSSTLAGRQVSSPDRIARAGELDAAVAEAAAEVGVERARSP